MATGTAKRKVCVIGLQGLGNLILTTPLLHALHQTGNCRLSLVVSNTAAAELMSALPFLDEVIVAADFSKFALIRRLRAGRFDTAVVAYPGGPRTSLLAGFSGANLKVGHQGRQPWVARRFLDVALPADHKAHDLDHNLELFRKLMQIWKMDPGQLDPDFQLSLPKADLQRAERWLAGQDFGEGPLVGLAPGCGWNQTFKRWPLENFTSLAKDLGRGSDPARTLWFLGPDEADLAGSLPGPVALGLPLLTTLALLTHCTALVSNDSGQMHMANALGVPTVSVFGPTDETHTGPCLKASRVIALDLDCRPCYSRHVHGFQCTNPDTLACLQGITVSRVAAALGEILASPGPGRQA